MAVLQEFKCPCCDGGIEFDSASQSMKCPFCETEFEVEALMSAIEYLDFIRSHPSIQRRIKEQVSLENIYEISKEMEEI